MPPPYRPGPPPAGTARRGPGSDVMDREGGFGAEIFLNREIYASRRGVPLKKWNFVLVLSNFAPQGVPLGHSAPSPIVPAGKLYTTRTMLPSGEGLKKRNFVGIMWNSSPVLASPFAPGGSLSFPCHCHFFPVHPVNPVILSDSSFFNFQYSTVLRPPRWSRGASTLCCT